MKTKDISEFFKRLQADNPAPKSDLEWTNPFTLLVAVVLSAQATDNGVNKATKNLFPIADTPEKMRALGTEGLKNHLKTLNFYNTKIKHVLALCDDLITKHHSTVPHTREALMELPGVGRKTANVVLNIVFQQPTMAVDTHIFRVGNRTGMAPGKTPEEVEHMLLKVVPPTYALHAHHWLILHGRYICKARKPLCKTCPVSDLCGWNDKQV